MEIKRTYIGKEIYEDDSVDGMFLTVLDTHGEVYGYGIAKEVNYASLNTHCFYYTETDLVHIPESYIDVRYNVLVLSTTEERLKMLDALRAYGYKWNFKTKQLEK